MSNHQTSLPHHVDVVKHMGLCRGRPVWYLLCRSDPFRSFVQTVWLDSLFPVVRVAGDVSQTSTLHVAGVSCGGGGEPEDANGCFSPLPSRQTRPAYLDFAQAPQDPSTQREHAMEGASMSAQHNIPTAFPNMSCRREHLLKGFRDLVETHSRRAAQTPLTMHGSMAGGKMVDTRGVGGCRGARHATAAVAPPHPYVEDPHYTCRQRGAASPPADRPVGHGGGGRGGRVGAVVGSSLSHRQGSPLSQRISSTMVLREEIAHARRAHSQQSHTATSTSSPSLFAAGGEAEECLGGSSPPPPPPAGGGGGAAAATTAPYDWMLDTPVLTRYRLWITTNRARSQVDRITEVLLAISSAMRSKGPLETMQSLVESVVQHPIEQYRQKISQTSTEREGTCDDSQQEHGSHSMMTAADVEHGSDDWFVRTRDKFFDASELALLELRVFGYLPANPSSSSNTHHPPALSATVRLAEHQPALLTNPSDLLRARLAMAKQSPLDTATHVELLLRHGGIKHALSLWWHWLPKHNVISGSTPPSPSTRSTDFHTVRPSTAEVEQRAVTTTTISRSTFVIVSILVHSALAGGTLPYASRAALDALKKLFYDDWPFLFMSYSQHHQQAGGGGRGATPVGMSNHFCSLLAKGMECPLSFEQPLFDIALMLLIEPWMETTATEERLLALAMLFERCFEEVTASAGDMKEGQINRKKFRLRLFPVQTVVKEDPPNDADQIVSPTRRSVPSRSPHRPNHKAITELVEQLEAATDPHLVYTQAERNRMENSDVSVDLTQEAWRNEVLRLNLRKARSHGASYHPSANACVAGSSKSAASPSSYSSPLLMLAEGTTDQLDLKRTFAPHDPARSYGLERVLLQRLAKRVADCSAAAMMMPAEGEGGEQGFEVGDDGSIAHALKTTEQASIIVHATKHLIPPQYLHEIARFHRSAVETFRHQVQDAMTTLERSGGISSGARMGHEGEMMRSPALADVQQFADALSPPPLRHYEKPVGHDRITKVAGFFVRRPMSASSTRHQNEVDGGDQTPDDGKDEHLLSGVSESLRRPLSALLGRSAAVNAPGRRSAGRQAPQPLVRPSSSTGGTHRRASAMSLRPKTADAPLYVSPYMKVGALPVTGGSAFTSKRPGSAKPNRGE